MLYIKKKLNNIGVILLFSTLILSILPNQRLIAGNIEIRHHHPYLLVSGYTPFGFPRYVEIDHKNIQVINKFPYDGVACALTGLADGVPSNRGLIHNDTSKVLEKEKYFKIYNKINSLCKKHIWPLVFFNRFVGIPNKIGNESIEGYEYFSKIAVMDIYDRTGALSDFLRLFRLALSLGRETGSPGIVIDPELYNQYPAMRISRIAEAHKIKRQAVVERLEEIGMEMARIIEDEFENAIVWSFYTANHLSAVNQIPWYDEEGDHLLSTGYIFNGLISYAKQKKIPLKVIDGGRDQIGYYNSTKKSLENKISRHYEISEDYIKKFNGIFFLGAPVTVWTNYKNNNGWMLKKAGKKPLIRSLDDFEPILKTLYKKYNYILYYSSVVTDYNPFDPENNILVHNKLFQIQKDLRLHGDCGDNSE